MKKLEGVALVPGQGQISGALAIFLGALSVLGVLCFHFPEYLTTPELRRTYDVDLLRRVLAAAIVAAAGFGAYSLMRFRTRWLGFCGVALALLAVWLGGANVEVHDFEQPRVSFGLDWLVLALLANSLLFIFIERMWPHRPEQLTFREEWRLDLVYYVFNHLAISVILLVTTFFSHELFGWAVNTHVQAAVRSQPVWLQFLEALFLADFMQYWAHRAMHENKRLWNFHAVHHCPARMDWLSGSRIHFVEVLLTRSFVILPIYILGFANAAVNAYVIWVGVQSMLIHSNVGLMFGPLRYLLVTPHFHHWHHSADAEAIDKNYAAHLPVLDMLFGSYIDNAGRWPESYGVVGKPLPHGFLAQHLYPFIARPKR
jgi:sterol desaturase/sphingolipid hydroxylase (fatty acid hydroxylase superfamily)